MPRLIPAEKKLEARRLRAEGVSVNQIASRLGIAKSSVSLLVRDIPLTDTQRARLTGNSEYHRVLGQMTWSRTCRERRARAQEHGRALARFADPGFIGGVMLYWAEGAKSRNQAKITNADAEVLRQWLIFLDGWYDIAPEETKLTVNCFLGNGLELAEIEQWWLDRLFGMPRACLGQSVVNRPSTASKSVRARRKLLYGTASLTVNSTFVVQSILRRHPGVLRLRAAGVAGPGRRDARGSHQWH